MPAAAIPINETERLEALRRYKVVDAGRDAGLDDISRLAAFICQTPVSAVTLIESDRQLIKASYGMGDVTEGPRDEAFCAHTILSHGIVIVEDARTDKRFADNPQVQGDPSIRFYAGAPLITPDLYNLGALCVVDHVPRTINAAQKEALTRLSRLVMTEFDLRKVSADLADSLREVKALRDILPTCSYCSRIRNDKGDWAQLQEYIVEETTSRFSHGICPECAKVHHPGYNLYPERKA